MSFNFTIKIYSPDGLENIAPYLDECRLKLNAIKIDNKVLLESKHGNELQWNMEPSKTNYIIATGTIHGDNDRAMLLLGDFEIALVSAGYPHDVCLKNKHGEFTNGSSYMWAGQHDS